MWQIHSLLALNHSSTSSSVTSVYSPRSPRPVEDRRSIWSQVSKSCRKQPALSTSYRERLVRRRRFWLRSRRKPTMPCKRFRCLWSRKPQGRLRLRLCKLDAHETNRSSHRGRWKSSSNSLAFNLRSMLPELK